jgi:hypothetical protein
VTPFDRMSRPFASMPNRNGRVRIHSTATPPTMMHRPRIAPMVLLYSTANSPTTGSVTYTYHITFRRCSDMGTLWTDPSICGGPG